MTLEQLLFTSINVLISFIDVVTQSPQIAAALRRSASRNGEFSQLWELLGADREKK